MKPFPSAPIRCSLISLFVFLVGVFLALLGFGEFSVQARQKPQVIMQSTDPLVPVGFDCSRVRELGIDKQENFRAGAIMIACGEAKGGTPSASSALFEAIKNALAPLAYGATDIDLVTGAETSPNVTQSETFAASDPDDPNQIVVAYNDSGGYNASPINISGASVSTDGGNTFAALTNASGQSPFSNTFGDPVFCKIDQRAPGSLSGWTGAAEVRVSADTSPPRRGARIAGLIFAFTITTKTTANIAGPTTIPPLHFMGECTFPGTTSMWAVVRSSLAIPPTMVLLGPTRGRSPAARRLSAMSRLPATLPQAMCRRRHERRWRQLSPQ